MHVTEMMHYGHSHKVFHPPALCPSCRRPILLIVAARTPLVHISLPSHFILACMLVHCCLYPSASRPPPPMPSHVPLRFPVLPDARQASFSSYGSHFSCSSYSFRSFCCSRSCFAVHTSLNLKAFNKFVLSRLCLLSVMKWNNSRRWKSLNLPECPMLFPCPMYFHCSPLVSHAFHAPYVLLCSFECPCCCCSPRLVRYLYASCKLPCASHPYICNPYWLLPPIYFIRLIPSGPESKKYFSIKLLHEL